MRYSLVSFLFLFTVLCLSCNKQNVKTFNIDIQLPPGDFDSLSYYISQDGITAYSSFLFTHIDIDSTGKLDLKIPTSEASWLFLSFFTNPITGDKYKMKDRLFLLAQPGKSCTVDFDTTHQRPFRISGDASEAQTYFNEFSQRPSWSLYGGTWIENTDTIPEILLLDLKDTIDNNLQPFQRLLEEEKIDSSYFLATKGVISYYQATFFLNYLNIRHTAYTEPERLYYKKAPPLKLEPGELNSLVDAVFQEYSPNHRDSRIAPGLGEYLGRYVNFKLRPDSSDTWWRTKSYKEKLQLLSRADEILDDDLVELYFADQFSSFPLKKGPDSLSIYMFPEFKKRYPDSKYLGGVIRHLNSMSEFYSGFYPGLYEKTTNVESVKEGPSIIFAPDVLFPAVSDTVSSMESLFDTFEGKKLFVDFWASWCPPCRYEFNYSDTLYKFLQTHNIELLYISSDENEEKWHAIINKYDLKGYHFRPTNPELLTDIRSVVHFIPTYWIVDSTGNVLNYNALKPSKADSLFNQILETLN